MKFSRRHFAKSSVLVAASLPILTRRTKANSLDSSLHAEEPHFFLFVQIYGAWDVCLAFDPKDRDLVLQNKEKQFDQPYSMNDVKEYSGIKLAPAGFVLGKYADRMAIVNGIDMEVDNGHTPDNMMTGVQGARKTGSPYYQAVLAKKHPYLKRCSVPHVYMSYDGQFIVGPYGNSSISATAGDFVTFISPGGSADSEGDFTTLQQNLNQYKGTLSQTKRQIFGTYINAIQSAVNVNTALKNYKFKTPDKVDQPQGVANLLGQLFASGVLGSATLSFGSKFVFDTHFNHYAMHPLQKALEEVDTLCSEFKKIKLDENHSVFDRTTVILTGEYSRTARLNSSQGKDHNFRSNSFVALGHNVKPGVYGLSGVVQEGEQFEAHAALPINYLTGKPDGDKKAIVRARNLWAGFGGIAGVDTSHDFGADTIPVKFF